MVILLSDTMDLFNFKGINYFLLYPRTLMTPAGHRVKVQLIEPSVSAHENVSAKTDSLIRY